MYTSKHYLKIQLNKTKNIKSSTINLNIKKSLLKLNKISFISQLINLHLISSLSKIINKANKTRHISLFISISNTYNGNSIQSQRRTSDSRGIDQ